MLLNFFEPFKLFSSFTDRFLVLSSYDEMEEFVLDSID